MMKIVGNYAVFAVDTPAPILEVFPDAKHVVSGGKHIIAVPHTVEHMSVMRSFGLDAPSPILHRYNWPGRYRPYAHQRHTAQFVTENQRAFVLNGLGTGKTNAVAWAADFLMREGVIRKALIISPLSTLQRVWADTLYQSFPHRKFVVLHGGKQARLDLAKQDWDFAIVNHHGVGIVKDHLPKELDLIIIDELAVLRVHTAKTLWGAAKQLIQPHHWVWGMTGTPTPNSPENAWAQVKLVKPENYNGSFTRWKNDVMHQISQYRWVPRRNSEQMVNQIMQPAIRYALEDCLDLPPAIFHEREAEMSPEQAYHYNKLKRECVTEARGMGVTAVNAAVLCGKLAQSACIASDTPVLTHRGWVPIQNVRRTDKVWDGDNFVNHAGVVDNGIRPVIDCGEVRLTEDHLILTTAGWKPAKEAKDGYASKRFTWAEVRFPDGYCESRIDAEQKFKVREMVMPLRLWERGYPDKSKSAQQEAAQRTTLRAPHGDMATTRHDQHPPISNMEPDAAQMRECGQQRLRQLWRARNYVLRTVGQIREFLGRYGTWVCTQPHTGESRQQPRIQPKQLSMGDSAGAIKQQANKRVSQHPTGAHDSIRSSAGVWVGCCDTARPDNQVQVAAAESTDCPAEATCVAQVYDIINCGPNSRFVVKAQDGAARIVHNCGVLYGANGEQTILDFGPRMKVLEECIESAGGSKVIIFAPLTGVIHALYEALKKDYSCEIIEGSTSGSKRDKVFSDFSNAKNPQIIIAAPQCMSHGLSLHQQCHTVIWYSGIASNETFTQANARTVRPGQTHHTNIFLISASPVERKIYQTLRERGRFQDIVLDLAKER